jgi:hypothetical protein
MRVATRKLAWLIGISLLFAVAPARAWVETRLVNDEVVFEVDRAGSAVVDHRITMRVAGGPLKSFDLAVPDKDVTPLESSVTAAGAESSTGTGIPLEIAARPSGGLRVNVTAPRGLSRGIFVFRVRYRRALVPGEDVRRDGAMMRVRLLDAVWTEGRDNARCVFVLPSAPTEPRAPSLSTRVDPSAPFDANDGVFISETHRSADHDEVVLTRPHVARGEAVAWTVLVDPRALGPAEIPEVRAAPPAPPRVDRPGQRALYAAGAALLLFGFSVLVAIKARQVARHARGVASPRPVVPLPTPLRALLAGPLLTAGVAMQLRLDDPKWGTLTVFCALLLAAYRRPTSRRAPRGPGQWLLLSDREAFSVAPAARGAWLDAGTRPGATLFASLLGALAVLGYVVRRASPYDAYLVAFDAAVLFPLFGTGRLADLPPHPLYGVGPRLLRVAKKVRALAGVRAVGWARLPEGGDTFDELRLLCAPRVPLRGFIGIEVGLVPIAGAGGYFFVPEILVRVIDASPCHDAFRALRPGARWVRGRRAEERVMSVAPRLPNVAMTTALTARLLEQARDTAPPTIARAAAPQRPAARSSPNSANAGNAATRSAGSGECASSAGTTPSPLHPT